MLSLGSNVDFLEGIGDIPGERDLDWRNRRLRVKVAVSFRDEQSIPKSDCDGNECLRKGSSGLVSTDNPATGGTGTGTNCPCSVVIMQIH